MVQSWPSRVRQMKVKSKTQLITIPKEVVTDADYPFKSGQIVNVKIDGERLILEKVNGDE